MEDTSVKIYSSSDELTYQDYVEYCKEMDIEPSPEGSVAYYQWESDTRQEIFDCVMCDIRYTEDYQQRCVVTGTLGLWNGHHEIYATIFDNVENAINKAIGSSECVEITFDEGVFNVSASHHDGTNAFFIRKLSKLGQSKTESIRNGETLFQTYVLEKWATDFKNIYK